MVGENSLISECTKLLGVDTDKFYAVLLVRW